MRIVNLLGGDVPALAGRLERSTRKGLTLSNVEALASDGRRVGVDGSVFVPWSAIAFVQELG